MCTKIICQYFLSFLWIAAILPTTPLHTQLDFTKGQIIYYPCDNINIVNKSPNRLPCTDAISDKISMTKGKENQFNSAYYFDGINDFAKLLDAPQFKQVAVSLWFRAESPTQGTLLGYEEGAYWIGLAQNGKLEVKLAVSNYNQYHYQSDISYSADRQWHHVVLNFSGEVFDIYVDGNLKESRKDYSAMPAIFYQDKTTLHIGSLPNQISFYNGRIDEIMIYNRALSKLEIDVLYQAKEVVFKENADPGLIIYSSFDQAALKNESHTLVNKTIGDFHISGKMGGINNLGSKASVKLNGINDALFFGEAAQLPHFSFGCWVNTNSTKKSYIASWEEDGFALLVNPADSIKGQIEAIIKLSSGETLSLVSGKIINDGEWHQLFLSFDGTAFRLYCDNLLMDNKDLFVGMQNTIQYKPNTKLIIGGKPTVSNAYFDGLIDDLLLYNYALAADEIGFLFRPNLKPKESPIQNIFFTRSQRLGAEATMVAAFNTTNQKDDFTITSKTGSKVYGNKRKIAPKSFILETIDTNPLPSSLKLQF